MEENTTVQITTTDSTRVCASCGTIIQSGIRFCPTCGEKSPEPPTRPRTCASCGKELSDGIAFCPYCGAKADTPAPVAEEKKYCCPSCYANVEKDAKFCKVCGHNFNDADTSAKKNKKTVIAVIAAAGLLIIGLLIALIANCGPAGSTPAALCSHEWSEASYTSPKSCSKCGTTQGSKKNARDLYNAISGNSTYCTVGSDNSYLEIDTNPYDLDDSFSSTAWSLIQKANTELGLPASVKSRMEATRSIDGRQTYVKDNITVSWTYHPDQGLEVLYELAN